jgi:hypothetical protein
VAHDVSDAEPATKSTPGIVGEPSLADRGLGGLAPETTWGAPLPARPAPAPPKRRRRDPHATRRPAIGLAALLVAGFLAAFFGWVSAEPFWLSMGRGADGTATVSSCRDSGPARPCVGTFVADGVQSDVVRLSGLPDSERRAGASVDAKMLDSGSRWAYSGPTNLRWQLGLVAVVVCGLLLGWATGVGRLRTTSRRDRFLLHLLSFAAPLTIYTGVVLGALV